MADLFSSRNKKGPVPDCALCKNFDNFDERSCTYSKGISQPVYHFRCISALTKLCFVTNGNGFVLLAVHVRRFHRNL